MSLCLRRTRRFVDTSYRSAERLRGDETPYPPPGRYESSISRMLTVARGQLRHSTLKVSTPRSAASEGMAFSRMYWPFLRGVLFVNLFLRSFLSFKAFGCHAPYGCMIRKYLVLRQNEGLTRNIIHPNSFTSVASLRMFLMGAERMRLFGIPFVCLEVVRTL